MAYIVKHEDRAKPWMVRYKAPDGRVLSQSFKKKDDADRFLIDQEHAKLVGEWVDPAVAQKPFEHFSEEWLTTIVDRKPKTIEGYRSILRRHILPTFGPVPVARIDRPMVRHFVADLTAKGLGAGTVKNALNVVKLVLATAVEAGAIRSNPAAGVSPPRAQRDPMRFLTAEEVARLADTITEPYRTLVTFAAYTGLRAGEIAVVRVSDLDLLKGRVQVRESVAEVEGKAILGPTKNHQQRSVSLPRFLCEDLAAYLLDRPNDPSALVFTSERGDVLRQSNFYRRIFTPAVVTAGLDGGLRFHDLRHTAAALMIELGAHPRAMMERLGHSSVTITLDTYGHLFPSLEEALTDGLDDRYRQAEISRRAEVPRTTRALAPVSAIS